MALLGNLLRQTGPTPHFQGSALPSNREDVWSLLARRGVINPFKLSGCYDDAEGLLVLLGSGKEAPLIFPGEMLAGCFPSFQLEKDGPCADFSACIF